MPASIDAHLEVLEEAIAAALTECDMRAVQKIIQTARDKGLTRLADMLQSAIEARDV
jgi:hypothetical protein